TAREKEEAEAKELQRQSASAPKSSRIVIPGKREPGTPIKKRRLGI
ncbi:5812_t:CDS:1, partial [Acaulospora morrowiae]